MIQKLFSRSRLRSARRHLAEEFTAENYGRLIQQLALAGELQSAAELVTEGLGHFPGDRGLLRVEARIQSKVREGRLARLRAELAEGPRPALWRSYAELCCDAGEWDEAEHASERWFESDDTGGAALLRAEVRTKRFFADRSRSAGEAALAAVAVAKDALPRDEAPLRLELRLALAAGAFGHAHDVALELLDLVPGDRDLESRCRALSSVAADAPDMRRALARVEETGRLATDRSEAAAAPAEDVRPALQSLAASPGCAATLFLRASTALVQGPRGATAQRTARGLKSALKASHALSRRLDLGPLRELEFEGDFGEVFGAVGSSDVAIGWWRRSSSPAEREHLRELAGAPLRGDGGGA